MRKRPLKGFTLIELMIVVAIIGILAAVAIPKFAEMLRKSKEGATKGGLITLRSVLDIYLSDNEGMTPLTYATNPNETVLLLALQPKYLEAMPTAKLGTYHVDSTGIEGALIANRGDVSTYVEDRNGWVYTSVSGGSWWVNCTHTDLKNTNISSW